MLADAHTALDTYTLGYPNSHSECYAYGDTQHNANGHAHSYPKSNTAAASESTSSSDPAVVKSSEIGVSNYP